MGALRAMLATEQRESDAIVNAVERVFSDLALTTGDFEERD